MALINCPECKNQVSNQAPTCPHCGFQIANHINNQERLAKIRAQNELLTQQKEIRREKFKKNKKKYILISVVSVILVVALIVGSVFLYNRLQRKTFSSESAMKSYVEGVYIEEHNELLNYRITIKDDYITEEKYGTMTNYTQYGDDYSFNSKQYRYHISEYDYKNGIIITDEETYYYSEKDENADSLIAYNEKSITNKWEKEFIVKVNNEIETDLHTYKKQIK